MIGAHSTGGSAQPPLPSARLLPARARGRAGVRASSPATNPPLHPAQLRIFLLLSRVSLGRTLFSSPPLTPCLPLGPRAISAGLLFETCAKESFPTPTLTFRAVPLRLRQSLPLEGAPVQQHPGPFTFLPPPPHPQLPAAWPAPPSVLRGGNCPQGGPRAGLLEWLYGWGIMIRGWGWGCGRARSGKGSVPRSPQPVAPPTSPHSLAGPT